jgi:uncharacterized repeat protein (TIGR03837 family)
MGRIVKRVTAICHCGTGQVPFMDNAAMPNSDSLAPPSPLLWDVFCRVIDNFGDIGVSWRLAVNLAARGQQVRLWVDDTGPLRWMAPGALEGRVPGISVLPWEQSQDPEKLSRLARSDVWVETFGCEIAPEFIAAYLYSMPPRGQKDTQVSAWINLEYLTAESFAERTHALPSPVMNGPAAGWTKTFFYPGFTPGTGGLLREPDLLARQESFDRSKWLAQMGLEWNGERLVSLFCYEPEALVDLLALLEADARPTQLLVTSGRASAAVKNLMQNRPQAAPALENMLSISYLPQLTQREFDHLLWACDLNFVRGEDSLVRALWAGKPLIWQIYPQDDGAHHHKLNAFLDMLGADDTLRQFHRAWNRGADLAPDGTRGAALGPLNLDAWQQTVTYARARLLEMDDLVSQLLHLVQKNR